MSSTAAASVTAPPVPAGLDRLTASVVSSGTTTPVVTPFTATPFADLPVSAPSDVETAYERARAAQREWARRAVSAGRVGGPARAPARGAKREGGRRAPAGRAAPFVRLHDAVLGRREE